MNPDGSGAGKKTNTRGVDLNRNWPTKNFRPTPPHANKPLSELECLALQKDIERFKPDVVLVFHSSYLGPFVHGAGKDPKLAIKLAGGARLIDARWAAKPELRYDTPGSLNAYLAAKKSTTVLTVELPRGRDPSSNTAAIRAGVLAAFGKGIESTEATPPHKGLASTPSAPMTP
jgi:murein peptide amidase A